MVKGFFIILFFQSLIVQSQTGASHFAQTGNIDLRPACEKHLEDLLRKKVPEVSEYWEMYNVSAVTSAAAKTQPLPELDREQLISSQSQGFADDCCSQGRFSEPIKICYKYESLDSSLFASSFDKEGFTVDKIDGASTAEIIENAVPKNKEIENYIPVGCKLDGSFSDKLTADLMMTPPVCERVRNYLIDLRAWNKQVADEEDELFPIGCRTGDENLALDFTACQRASAMMYGQLILKQNMAAGRKLAMTTTEATAALATKSKENSEEGLQQQEALNIRNDAAFSYVGIETTNATLNAMSYGRLENRLGKWDYLEPSKACRFINNQGGELVPKYEGTCQTELQPIIERNPELFVSRNRVARDSFVSFVDAARSESLNSALAAAGMIDTFNRMKKEKINEDIEEKDDNIAENPTPTPIVDEESRPEGRDTSAIPSGSIAGLPSRVDPGRFGSGGSGDGYVGPGPAALPEPEAEEEPNWESPGRSGGGGGGGAGGGAPGGLGGGGGFAGGGAPAEEPRQKLNQGPPPPTKKYKLGKRPRRGRKFASTYKPRKKPKKFNPFGDLMKPKRKKKKLNKGSRKEMHIIRKQTQKMGLFERLSKAYRRQMQDKTIAVYKPHT